MKILVTGGAGFIGRWVVGKLLELNHEVIVLDNMSSGSASNLAEFKSDNNLKDIIQKDIREKEVVDNLFKNNFDISIHLAARINVQDSIDNPVDVFECDVAGTFNLLENARANRTKFIFISTCMVYGPASDPRGIDESHPVKPASPYAASKLSGEYMTLSYYHAYGLPAAVLRPFNTYGPFQKSSGEGGVAAIFVKNNLLGQNLSIYGDGTQTRDFLYAADCADFIVKASLSEKAAGQIINAGSGRDISINRLAEMIADNKKGIRHVPHIHPQSEIARLKCNCEKAKRLLGWEPKVDLAAGLAEVRKWIELTQKELKVAG